MVVAIIDFLETVVIIMNSFLPLFIKKNELIIKIVQVTK